MIARAKIIYFLMIKVKLFSFLLQHFLKQIENMLSVFLSSFSTNLLPFKHESRSLIGYTAHYLIFLYIVSSFAACAGTAALFSLNLGLSFK